jgi:hypothetical protein
MRRKENMARSIMQGDISFQEREQLAEFLSSLHTIQLSLDAELRTSRPFYNGISEELFCWRLEDLLRGDITRYD